MKNRKVTCTVYSILLKVFNSITTVLLKGFLVLNCFDSVSTDVIYRVIKFLLKTSGNKFGIHEEISSISENIFQFLTNDWEFEIEMIFNVM